MGASIFRVLFCSLAVLFTSSVLAIDISLDCDQPSCHQSSGPLNYSEAWSLPTKIAFNYLRDDLEKERAEYLSHGRDVSDSELDSISMGLIMEKGKKWAGRAVMVLIGVGVNFGLYAGYDNIPVSFVSNALSAMTIAVDVRFLQWLLN